VVDAVALVDHDQLAYPRAHEAWPYAEIRAQILARSSCAGEFESHLQAESGLDAARI
jgi:hypothetical protein